MITCDEALELISAKLDGALSVEETAELSAHLASCQACGRLLADLEEIHAACRRCEDVAPPADLAAHIMAEIHASKVTPYQAKRRVWKRRSWASLAAVCAIAVLGAGAMKFWSAPPSATAGEPAPMMVMARQSGEPSGAPDGKRMDTDRAEAGSPSAQSINAPSPTQENAPNVPTPTPEPAAGSAAPAAMTMELGPSLPPSPPLGRNMVGNSTLSTPFPTAAPAQLPSPAPTEQVAADASPLPLPQSRSAGPVYCGILTLPAGDAPDLSSYDAVQDGADLHYLLPAGDFVKLADALLSQDGVTLTTEGDTISPEAPQGLIIVTP